MATAYAQAPTSGRSECCKAPFLAEVTKDGVLIIRKAGRHKHYHAKCSRCGCEYDLLTKPTERVLGEVRVGQMDWATEGFRVANQLLKKKGLVLRWRAATDDQVWLRLEEL